MGEFDYVMKACQQQQCHWANAFKEFSSTDYVIHYIKQEKYTMNTHDYFEVQVLADFKDRLLQYLDTRGIDPEWLNSPYNETFIERLADMAAIQPLMRKLLFDPLGVNQRKCLDEIIGDSAYVDVLKDYRGTFHKYFTPQAEIVRYVLNVASLEVEEPIHASNSKVVRSFVKSYALQRLQELTTSQREDVFKAFRDNEAYVDKTNGFLSMAQMNAFYRELKRIGTILPKSMDGYTVSPTRTQMNWLAKLIVRELQEIVDMYFHEKAVRISNHKINKRDYDHMAQLYTKLAERKAKRLAEIDQVAIAHNVHVKRQKEHSLVQAILKKDFPEDSVFTYVKRTIIQGKHYQASNDVIKNHIKSVMEKRLNQDNSTINWEDHIERKRQHYIEKGERIRQVSFKHMHATIGGDNIQRVLANCNDFETFVLNKIHKSLYSFSEYSTISSEQYAQLLLDYKKYLAKRSLSARMNSFASQGRTAEQIEEGKRTWKEKFVMKNLMKIIDASVEKRSLTITSKGKRIFA